MQKEAGLEDSSTEYSASAKPAEGVEKCTTTSSTEPTHIKHSPMSAGYVMKNAELLVATPLDYLFLLLPSLVQPSSAKPPSSKGLFLSADDFIEKLTDVSKHFDHIANDEATKAAIEGRMRAVCDTVDAGDEKMYRLNDRRLLDELLLKAKAMVAMGLPASMEERFVRKALELPVMTIKHEDSSVSETNASQNDSRSEAASSVTSATTLISESSAASAVTEVTVPDDPNPAGHDSEVYHLLRLRTAFSYMLASYLPSSLATTLQSLLASSESPKNFEPLDERLAHLAQMRAEALAARSLGDFSRKRSMFEEDDATETRAEKKRRKEEEEKKKKAGESRGIRDLKKVDTKGMKKMSDFFGKGAAGKKK